MKKVFLSLASAACALATFASAGCAETNSATASGEAYLTVDINPSLEFLLEDDKVVSVKACNADGATLISGEIFVGLDSEECLKKVVELAEDTGYLNEENAEVDIAVAADDEDVRQKIEERAKKGAAAGSIIAKVNVGARVQDVREVKKLQAEDAETYKSLTPVKYRLITAVMQFDETMTYEIGAKKSIKELKEILEEYRDEFEDYAGEELKDAMKEAKDAAKELMEKGMARLCGEEYAAKFEKYLQYKKAYEELKKQAENAVISAEDEAAIALLLEKNDLSEVGQTGKILAEKVEDFVDKLRDLSEETREEIEEILDKYDEDDVILSEGDLEKFGELIGELGETTKITLDELEDLIEDFKDELEEECKAFLEAHPELKEQIDNFKDAFQKTKYELKDAFKNRIERKKAEFASEKERRLMEFKKGNAA